MKAKLKRCPFCNGHHLELQRHHATSNIRCINCGATGPDSSNDDDALIAWNDGEYESTSLVNMLPGESNRDDLREVEL